MITITREKKFNLQGWQWIYRLIGPDKYLSTNKSLPTLHQMAEKRYPGVEIAEEWNQEDETPAPAIEKLLAITEAAQAYVDICVNPGHGTTELLALMQALDELKGETA